MGSRAQTLHKAYAMRSVGFPYLRLHGSPSYGILYACLTKTFARCVVSRVVRRYV